MPLTEDEFSKSFYGGSGVVCAMIAVRVGFGNYGTRIAGTAAT